MVEAEGSMGTSFESALGIAAAVAIMAGVVALALSVLSIGLLRRALRRVIDQIEELRRHPLVGVLPPETDPALRALTLELNNLLADLRARLQEAAKRSADLEGLAAGPPDLALIGADADWTVTFFSRGAVNLLGWAPEEIAGRHVEALFAPGEWDRLLPKLARRSLREAGLSEVVRLLRRDGTAFPAPEATRRRCSWRRAISPPSRSCTPACASRRSASAASSRG